MRSKITIIGVGNVGASCALWLARRGLADLVLVDIPAVKTMPVGKGLDLLQAGPIEHYNARIRGNADGSYDGWGLHTWESFQKKEEAGDEWGQKQMADRPLKGVTWFSPLKPAGKDDLGIYWLVPMSEYDNGRVNYIIHKGDKKDQCNKDMFWLIKDSKELWVNAGDCKSYLSKADALKARK